MSNTADMSTPVTRGELQEELAKLATKADLEIWGGVLREEMKQLITTSHKELQADLALHAGALFESMSALIRAYDDKYKDLPDRMTQLEAKVSKRKAR